MHTYSLPPLSDRFKIAAPEINPVLPPVAESNSGWKWFLAGIAVCVVGIGIYHYTKSKEEID